MNRHALSGNGFFARVSEEEVVAAFDGLREGEEACCLACCTCFSHNVWFPSPLLGSIAANALAIAVAMALDHASSCALHPIACVWK